MKDVSKCHSVAAGLFKLLADEDQVATAKQGAYIAIHLKEIIEAYQSGLYRWKEDPERAAWFAVSITGNRSLADDIFDVADTDWRKEIDAAEKQVNHESMSSAQDRRYARRK